MLCRFVLFLIISTIALFAGSCLLTNRIRRRSSQKIGELNKLNFVGMYGLNSIPNALVKVVHVIAQDFVQLADLPALLFSKRQGQPDSSCFDQPAAVGVDSSHLVIPGVVVLSERLVLTIQLSAL